MYANGVVVRLAEALGETFEAVWWVCGDEYFFQLAKHYIVTHPSQTYNLSCYGQDFPDFLEQTSLFPDLPFLRDLARYEWAFKELFHRGQQESVSGDALQSLANESSLYFQFVQSSQLFSSRYAIYDLWKLRGTAHAGKPPVEWNRPQRLVLYKHHHQIFVHEVGQYEFQILDSLQAGRTLEESLTLISEQNGEINQDQVSQLFQFMVSSGIIHTMTKEPLPGSCPHETTTHSSLSLLHDGA